MNGILREDHLETRDLRDVLDRVLDKGIVLDPASRISVAGEEHMDGGHIVIGTFDTQIGKRAA